MNEKPKVIEVLRVHVFDEHNDRTRRTVGLRDHRRSEPYHQPPNSCSSMPPRCCSQARVQSDRTSRLRIWLASPSRLRAKGGEAMPSDHVGEILQVQFRTEDGVHQMARLTPQDALALAVVLKDALVEWEGMDDAGTKSERDARLPQSAPS